MDKRFLLKDQRSQLGLTQIELAKQLEVSNNTVARWESGVLPISRVVELAMERLVSIHSFKGVSRTVNQSESLMTFADVMSKLKQIGKRKSDSSLRRYLQTKKLKGEKMVTGEWEIKKSDFVSFINSDFFKSLK